MCANVPKRDHCASSRNRICVESVSSSRFDGLGLILLAFLKQHFRRVWGNINKLQSSFYDVHISRCVDDRAQEQGIP